MLDSELISSEMSEDLERESVLRLFLRVHQNNIDNSEFLRGKEIVVLLHDSPLFRKLKAGHYFNDGERAPQYFKGDRVGEIVDILTAPQIVLLNHYEKELEELKKKYLKEAE